MKYNGKKLTWTGHGHFNATSGLWERYGDEDGNGVADDWRSPRFQKLKNHGPIPEGKYYMLLREDSNPYASYNINDCSIPASRKLQRIPRKKLGIKESDSDACEIYWANWGENRINIRAFKSTKTLGRGGFYIHDSTKGFTHGCIEVDTVFFDLFRKFLIANEKKPYKRRLKRLNLEVKYLSKTMKTYGGTIK